MASDYFSVSDMTDAISNIKTIIYEFNYYLNRYSQPVAGINPDVNYGYKSVAES
jgi:hypothetical protein